VRFGNFFNVSNFSLWVVLFVLPITSCSSTNFQFEGNPQHYNFSHGSVHSFRVHVGGRVIAPPSMKNNRIFISSGKISENLQSGQVVAINARSGRILWRTSLPNVIMTQPVVTKKMVIVGMGGKRMFTTNKGYSCKSHFGHGIIALHTNNGKIAWMHLTRCQVMPTPTYVNHEILGPTGGGHFIALNAHNGHLLWKIPISGWSAMSSPLRSGSNVFFGTDNSFTNRNLFYGINWKSRRIIWSHNFKHVVNLAEASPVLDDGIVFTAFMHNSQYGVLKILNYFLNHKDMRYYTFDVVGMNSKNGRILYRKEIYTKSFTPGAWLHAHLIDDRIYWRNWLDAAFRKVADFINIPVSISNPNKPIPKKAGIYDPPLTAWHNIVFVEPRLTGRLYALDARSEKVLWSLKTGEDISNPSIYRGLLYLVNAKGVLYVIKACSGKVVFIKKLKTGAVGPADGLLSSHHIVVGGASGEVVSLRTR